MSIIKTKVTVNDNRIEHGFEGDMKVGLAEGGEYLIINYLTNLYADPYKAAVREMVANAIDAEATKIEMYVDYVDDTVTFTDYGCGMSTETLKNNYITYANSDKFYDYDKIGAFGLGAKAPLAISSKYTVETFDGEECTVAEVARTTKGIYADIKHATPKHGCSYTTITFKVDGYTESNKIVKAALFFGKYIDVPFFLGDEQVNYHFCDTGCGIKLAGVNKEEIVNVAKLANYETRITPVMIARIGGVPYRVEEPFDRPHEEYVVVADFDVTEVSLPPSRESLSNDDNLHLVGKIKRMLDECYEYNFAGIIEPEYIEEKLEEFAYNCYANLHGIRRLSKTNSFSYEDAEYYKKVYRYTKYSELFMKNCYVIDFWKNGNHKLKKLPAFIAARYLSEPSSFVVELEDLSRFDNPHHEGYYDYFRNKRNSETIWGKVNSKECYVVFTDDLSLINRCIKAKFKVERDISDKVLDENVLYTTKSKGKANNPLTREVECYVDGSYKTVAGGDIDFSHPVFILSEDPRSSFIGCAHGELRGYDDSTCVWNIPKYVRKYLVENGAVEFDGCYDKFLPDYVKNKLVDKFGEEVGTSYYNGLLTNFEDFDGDLVSSIVYAVAYYYSVDAFIKENKPFISDDAMTVLEDMRTHRYYVNEYRCRLTPAVKERVSAAMKAIRNNSIKFTSDCIKMIVTDYIETGNTTDGVFSDYLGEGLFDEDLVHEARKVKEAIINDIFYGVYCENPHVEGDEIMDMVRKRIEGLKERYEELKVKALESVR